MFVARKGDPIVCPNGHIGGHVERDILPSETLKPRGDFSITITNAGNHTSEGHSCAQCPERITRYSNGVYQIRTARGWIGHLS